MAKKRDNKPSKGYSVYIHTVRTNGKKYIGITSGKTNKRWQGGHGYDHQVFGKAVKKYGWDNIDHVVVITDIDKETAKQWEMALVAQYHTNDPNYGYNLTAGGDCPPDKKLKHTEEWKRQMSIRNSGDNSPSAKSVICLETLRIYKSIITAQKETGASKISDCCNRRNKHNKSGGYHWAFYDETKSNDYYSELLSKYIEEEKTRLENSWKNSKLKEFSNIVSIICLETLEVYSSINEASKITRISKSQICSCCKGKAITAGNLHWSYYDSSKPIEYYKNLTKKRRYEPNRIPIICLETKEVFDSTVDASEHYGIQHSSITRSILRNNGVTAGGYHWRRYDSNKSIKYYEEEYRKIVPPKSQKRKVILLEELKIFDTVIDAARYCGGNDSSSIIKCCTGKAYTYKGLHWSYYDERNPMSYYENISISEPRYKNRRWVQNIETGEVFKSIASASKSVNKSHSLIARVVNKEDYTAGGYHWRYAD